MFVATWDLVHRQRLKKEKKEYEDWTSYLTCITENFVCDATNEKYY